MEGIFGDIVERLKDVDWLVIGSRAIGAIVILLVGMWVVNILMRVLSKLMTSKHMDKSLQGFTISLLSTILKVIVVLAAIGSLGVDLSALFTVIAACSLAVGMALQGSLSNLAGGALILFFRPFKVGDYIAAQGEEGVVKKIEIFTTKLNTTDNKEVIIPNGALSNGNVTNFSSEGKRRVDLVFGVSYDADMKETKDVLMSVAKSFKGVIGEPHVRVCELGESSVNFTTRVWVKTESYWDAYFHIIEEGKSALDKAGIDIPYPHCVEISKQG